MSKLVTVIVEVVVALAVVVVASIKDTYRSESRLMNILRGNKRREEIMMLVTYKINWQTKLEIELKDNQMEYRRLGKINAKLFSYLVIQADWFGADPKNSSRDI